MWEEMEMWQFSLLSQQKVHPYYIKLKNKFKTRLYFY